MMGLQWFSTVSSGVLFLLAAFLDCSALAQEQLEIEVTVPKAIVYAEQNVNSKQVGQLKRGKKIQAVGPLRSGFYKLKSRSGRDLFVQVVEVRQIQSDLFEVPGKKSQRQKPQRERPRRGNYVSWDLGASTGSVGDMTYSEVNLGVNIFFKEWLAWRNAGFYRFVNVEGVDNVYGLDSMIRLYQQFDFSELAGVTFFGGPGYRFINEGDNVPFAEGGLILKLAGLSLGGGVRTFFTKFVDEDAENDTQFFIVLSGSGII
jgi:hypothetical protein